MLRTRNIAWLFLSIIKEWRGGGGGENYKVVQTNSSFSHFSIIFVADWKFSSVVFYCWLFWITLKACNYPLHRYDTSLNNFWSPKEQLKYLGKWGKIFIYQIFLAKIKLCALERRFHQMCLENYKLSI